MNVQRETCSIVRAGAARRELRLQPDVARQIVGIVRDRGAHQHGDGGGLLLRMRLEMRGVVGARKAEIGLVLAEQRAVQRQFVIERLRREGGRRP